jgi:two-component sensor histidine kinase
VLTVVSIEELRQTSKRHMEAYLALGLEYYIQEHPQRLFDLLQRHGLEVVPSFVQSYQKDAADAASTSILQMGARIVIISMQDGQILSSTVDTSQPGVSGNVVGPHIQEHTEYQSMDEYSIHFDPTTNSYYVFTIFEPWNWIVVASAPDQFVRNEIRMVMLRTVLTTTGILLISALVLAIILRWFFVAPVLRIASAARQLPAAVALSLNEAGRTDELGRLARDIITASQTIDRTQRELRESNENLELVVRERTSELADALRQQKTLVREVNHRVKNNMSVIQAFMELQKNRSSVPEVADALSSIQSRIESMTLIHEQLNQGDGTLATIDSSLYLEALVKELRQSLFADERSITIKPEIETVQLALDVAIPCGLITNELVSNASKYAFPGNCGGAIVVRFGHADARHLCLSVSDDGVGIDMARAPDRQKSSGLGSQIVSALAAQLHGRLTTVSDNGVVVTVTFPYI